MPSRIRHPEWRSSLDDTKYPFSPVVSLQNTAGMVIPPSVFIDAHLYPIGGSCGTYLSKIDVSSGNVTLHIGDDNAESIATTEIAINNLDQYTSTAGDTVIQLKDAHQRPAGVFISTPLRLSIFAGFGTGEHTFTKAQTEFVATVCMPTPAIGVRGVILPDGSTMTGDVWLVGGSGVVLSYSDTEVIGNCNVSTVEYPTIRVDAVGDPLFLRKLCEVENPNPGEDLFLTPKFIKTINIMNTSDSGESVEWEAVPDAHGRLFVQGNDSLATKTSLRVRTTSEGNLELSVAGTSNYQVD